MRRARLSPGELVLDLGAGTGAVTEPLRRAGARVIAVECDAASVRRLRRRFTQADLVSVVDADLLTVPLPRRPFRVVANLPFGVTSAVLRRLLGSPGLVAADVVVADGVVAAVGRARPPSVQVLRWAVRYELRPGRRVSAESFRPVPSVDAGVLVVRRRAHDLVREPQLVAYDDLVTRGLSRPETPWTAAARHRLTRRQLSRFAAERELDPVTPAARLGADEWAALARLATPR